MERRSFLKIFLGTPVVVAVQPAGEGLFGFLAMTWRKLFPRKATKEEAMVEPIRRALDYQAIGRKLLMVDELPQGAFARYKREVRCVARYISRNRESWEDA